MSLRCAPFARMIKMRSKHTSSSLFELVKYLQRERPQALLAVKERAIKTAVLARRLSGLKDCKLAGRLGTNLRQAMEQQQRNFLQKWFRFQTIRWTLPYADALIGVSQGVTDSFQIIGKIPPSILHVVQNPVITELMFSRAKEPVPHPWLASDQLPVMIGIGRLTLQKNFSLLIRAFAAVSKHYACRLVILGDGEDRAKLNQLCTLLKVADKVLFAGFQANPYAYLSRAKLFVLSSLWEGSPNVLTEAMALGVPVVATDCPSGPREILQGGAISPLVPLDDVECMQQAMLQQLHKPSPASLLQKATEAYSVDHSTLAYMKILGLSV